MAVVVGLVGLTVVVGLVGLGVVTEAMGWAVGWTTEVDSFFMNI